MSGDGSACLGGRPNEERVFAGYQCLVPAGRSLGIGRRVKILGDVEGEEPEQPVELG
jgi:hypothetical protein